MGRMADARKRARQKDAATKPPEPGAKRPAPVAEPSFAGEPEIRQEPVVQEPLASEAPVFAEEPEAASAVPAGEHLALPASGLAEEILARLDSGEAESVARPERPAGSHSLSFFAAPAQDQRAAAEATEHLTTFFLDREEYGVDVRQVQEIRRVTEITSVPRAPEFIRGVINLRGRILPVLDLRKKLGLGEVAASRDARIVVVKVKERLLGLIVDAASQVLKVAVSKIEPPPEEVVEKGGDYIRGVAKLDDRLIILVDLERLLAQELGASGTPAPGARAALGGDGVSQE